MPYISRKRRIELDARVSGPGAQPVSPGELAYVLSREVQRYLEHNFGAVQARYADLAGVAQAVESTRSEFVRHVLEPYEDAKLLENGPVFRFERRSPARLHRSASPTETMGDQ